MYINRGPGITVVLNLIVWSLTIGRVTVNSQTERQCDTVNSLRLRNGQDQFEGRVEICTRIRRSRSRALEWRAVCDDGWDVREASVVCRQLGFETGRQDETAVATESNYFGKDERNVNNVRWQCSGTESTLANCRRSNSCASRQSAGVYCKGHDRCSEGELRIVDGRDEREGRVEVCFSGVWGTVCNDQWNNKSASVVCQQLGLGDIGVATSAAAQFGEGIGPILLDDVECSGSESHIAECAHRPIGVHNCDHQQDAGVICPSALNDVTTISELTTGSTTLPPALKSPKSNSQTNVIIATTVVIVLLILGLIIAVVAISVFLLSRRKRNKSESQQEISDESSYYAELEPNQTPVPPQHVNPLHNSPVYSVIKNGNPLPFRNNANNNGIHTHHLEASVPSDYVEPIDTLNTHKKNTVPTDYAEPIDTLNAHKKHTQCKENNSTLDPPVEHDYATLESFILSTKTEKSV